MLISKLRPWTFSKNNPLVALTRSLMVVICSHSSEIPSMSLKVAMNAGRGRPHTNMDIEQKHCRMRGIHMVPTSCNNVVHQIASARPLDLWQCLGSFKYVGFYCVVWTYWISVILKAKPFQNVWITTSPTPICYCKMNLPLYMMYKIMQCYPHGIFPTILMQSWPSSQLVFQGPGLSLQLT